MGPHVRPMFNVECILSEWEEPSISCCISHETIQTFPELCSREAVLSRPLLKFWPQGLEQMTGEQQDEVGPGQRGDGERRWHLSGGQSGDRE